MVKKILLGILLLLVIVIGAGGLFLYRSVNADINEHFAGSCTELELPGSGEDIQMDHERGFAYLSVLDRMGVAKKETIAPGQILRVDLRAATPAAENALLSTPEYLNPHGLSLHIDANGQRYLFMINHPPDRENGEERIELFTEESAGQYRHQETFASPLITRANDLVAVGPRQFYVAQDTGQGGGPTTTDLVYFNGEEFSVVADDIRSGGGINVSTDGSTLYIAETNANAIRVARIEPDGRIATLEHIELDSAPDNINVADDGSLWVGAHSNLAALVMHFIVGSKSPTQILRVVPGTQPADIREIYLNGGTQISAGSGADSFEDQLLIGSITDKKILICNMD